MEEWAMKERRKEKQDIFDLDTLLHPARAFKHPMDVVRDADLTLNEKRAILASWASDACALEAAPDLRLGTLGNVIRWDDIMDALRTLDKDGGKPLPHYKRVLVQKERRRLGPPRFRWRHRNDQGARLN
jgi:hypothetical protein